MGLQKVHSKQGSIICTQRFQIPDTAPKNPKIRFYYFGRFSHALHSESRLPEDLCNQCWFLLIDSKETRDLISVDEKSWKWVIHYRALTCFRQFLPPFRPSFKHSNCLSVFPSGGREIFIFLLLSWTLPANSLDFLLQTCEKTSCTCWIVASLPLFTANYNFKAKILYP